MKILNTVYGDATGGRWQAFLDINNTLTQHGHEVKLLRGSENDHLNSQGKPIDIIDTTGFYDPIGALKVRKYLQQYQPDIIIAHSGKAVWLMKNALLGFAKKIPVIAVNHSHNVKRTLRADAFIHITPYVQQLVQARQTPAEKQKPQQVISNLTYLPPVSAEPQPIKQPPTITMLTRMVPNKGVHVLIDALAILKNNGVAFNAVLAGTGEMLDTYQRQAEQLGLSDSVTFAGWVGGEQKLALLEDTDILTLPSITEIQGIGILDAFAWGKPLVTTDDIGIRQTAKHGINAWCTKAGDAQCLADGLAHVIGHPDLALRLAKQGKKEALEHYNFDAIGSQHDVFIKQVADHYQVKSNA